MPSRAEILASTSAIANDAIVGAVIWHVVVAAVVFALLAGWRPSQRASRVAIALPLASVAAFAFA